MIPKKLERYEIIEWLGGGRFGDVYLVRDKLLDKKFALKMGRGKGDVDGYLKEAKIISGLEHPNIIRFYTADMIEGRIFIVTEFIKGKSLREVIEKEAPMDIKTALSIGKDILKGLSYAHKRGIIHRDLKPENIMITKDNTVKIVDFGISRIGEDITASIAGTPPYMPKEAWKGKYDVRSDEWSAALIIYEMLTGVNPFFSENLEEVRKKIFKGKIRPLKTVASRINIEVEETLEKALSPDMEDRFPTVDDFLRTLREESHSTILTMKMKKRSSIKGLPYPLTEEEREALIHKENVLLLGGPGTGKTYTLMAKVIDLINKGTPPESVVVTTFTLRNWHELKKRIEKELGTTTRDIILGNFHNLCLRILRRDIGILGFPEDFTVVPSSTQAIIMKSISKNYGVNHRYAMRRIQEYKARGLKAKEFIERKMENTIIEIWDQYQKRLKKENRLDYDDVLIFTRDILKGNPGLKNFYANKFKHLIIDEYQDLNPIQVEIIRLLFSGKNHVFATGDDDQMIYGWRGANPKTVKFFAKYFPPSIILKLTRSFRLPASISNAAANLIKYNRDREEKVIFPRNMKGEGIIVKQFTRRNSEASFLIKEITKLVKEGYNFSEIAVMFRVNRYSRLIAESLLNADIPYSSLGGGFYERKEIAGLIRLMEFLITKRQSKLLSAINFPETIVKKTKKAKSIGLKDYIEGKKDKRVEEKYKKLLSLSEMIKGMGPATTVRSIVKSLGLIEYYSSKESGIERIENINEFIQSSEDFEEKFPGKNLNAYITYVKDIKRAGLSGQEGVNLLTVHSAKGLEFPVVFILGLEEGLFPLLRSMTTRKEMEEERRLMYVAMTRTVRKLYLTYSSPAKPSRFLSEIFGQ